MKRAFVALALMLAGAASAQRTERPVSTGRDVYVGCYLLVHNTDVPPTMSGDARDFSAIECMAQSVLARTEREGRSATASNRYRFCLPETLETASDPARAMAFAYLEYFERYPRIAAADGRAAYVLAMVDKWPCTQ